jgi:hypothetical protein
MLRFIDSTTGELDPAPFYSPLVVGRGPPISDGIALIARRPGRAGVDFAGPDLFALSNLASRVVPIELEALLGP